MALSSGNLAVWELDLEKNEVTVSAELNRLYGFPEDAKPSVADYMSRYAPGEVERTARLSAEVAAAGGTRLEVEVKHIWPDGTVKWLLIRAEAAPPAHGSGRARLASSSTSLRQSSPRSGCARARPGSGYRRRPPALPRSNSMWPAAG